MKTTRNKVGSHIAEPDSNTDAVQPGGTLNLKRSVRSPNSSTSWQYNGQRPATAILPNTIKGIRRAIRTAATMDSKIRMGR